MDSIEEYLYALIFLNLVATQSHILSEVLIDALQNWSSKSKSFIDDIANIFLILEEVKTDIFP